MIQWIIFTDERADRPRASKRRQPFVPCRFAVQANLRGGSRRGDTSPPYEASAFYGS